MPRKSRQQRANLAKARKGAERRWTEGGSSETVCDASGSNCLPSTSGAQPNSGRPASVFEAATTPTRSSRTIALLSSIDETSSEEESEAQADDDGNSTECTQQTASERKISLPAAGEQTDGFSYFLAGVNPLEELMKQMSCSKCGSSGVKFRCEKSHFGMCCKMIASCSSTECDWELCQYSSTAIDNRAHLYDVNRRVVHGVMKMGKGYSSLELLCGALDMPCMSWRGYDNNQSAICKTYAESSNAILQKAWKSVAVAHASAGNFPGEDGILDITVSFDGTWQKRGFQSNYCVGFAIETVTGLVVDFECLSKYCQACALAESDLGKDSPEFDVWVSGHRPDCCKNWDSSSPAMETGICEVLWKRSIEKCRMRYTTLLSDGDAKNYSRLCELMPYGPTIKIEKEECVNHVAKRLGTALRGIRKKESLGGKGEGKLTDFAIKKLTYYYGHAIRTNNKGDLSQMKTAIYASLLHYSSTDEKPRHEKCPTGADSWCFFNRQSALGHKPDQHKGAMKVRLSKKVFEAVMPIYQRLASDALLARCLSGKTQNANESIHSVLWAHCPKAVFVGKKRLEGAVSMTIGQWNMGALEAMSTVMNALGTPSGSASDKVLRRKDTARIKRSKRLADKSLERLKRHKKKQANQREQHRLSAEGPSYGAGQFD